MGEPVAIKPHQAAGHRRRRQPGNADAVPHRVGVHQRFAAAVDFVAEDHRGDKVKSARAGKLGGGERNWNIVAWMAAACAALRMGADHIVIEIEHADEGAIGEHGIRCVHSQRMTEHRALRGTAERCERRHDRAGDVVIERRKAAT
jgi:hypothetical protein